MPLWYIHGHEQRYEQYCFVWECIKCLSRTTFSGMYEPEWDSVSTNRANDTQAGQAEHPISHENGPMTQIKPISMVSGPGALEEPHSSQGSLAFRDHLSCTWKSQPENEGKPQKRKKANTEPRVEGVFFTTREIKKESRGENGWVSWTPLTSLSTVICT